MISAWSKANSGNAVYDKQLLTDKQGSKKVFRLGVWPVGFLFVTLR